MRQWAWGLEKDSGWVEHGPTALSRRNLQSSIGNRQFPSRLYQRVHVIQIPQQRGLAGRRQAELGAGRAAVKRLETRDVAGFLELARVHAQVAVGGLQQLLQVGEAEDRRRGQRADDAEPETLVDQAIEMVGR